MMKHVSCAALIWGMAVLAGSAPAAEKLEFAPVPAWVRPILTPAAPLREDALGAFAVLNRSLQLRFSDTGDSAYWETLVAIQTPRGLSVARPTVEWDPINDTITINRVHLIRNGQVIDLLARGQTFTYLRREPELEKAILSGELTAVLQPDGVEVGDILDFAYTRTRRPGIRGTRSERLWVNIGATSAAQRDTRFVWPTAKAMRWRFSPDLPVPTVIRTADETELSLNLDGYERPEAPEAAPGRFSRFGEVQFSQFTTWQEVSALMAPYYDRAATLSAASPLKAEAAKIRALSPDPKVQAAAALHLVQQAIRYNYVKANDGGFVPPAADLTWLRRWGDCKAKTALLTALLRELGITADPALVDTGDGDGMDERLPALALFDHIIVRATIDGRAYWLDGTRDFDGGLDDLVPPDEKWALPLTAAVEALVPLTVAPLDAPQVERRLHLDATGGLDAPVAAHAEFIMHGSPAVRAASEWRGSLPEDMDTDMRAYWKRAYPWIEVTARSEWFDPAKTEMHYVMDGTGRIASRAASGLAGDGRRLYDVPDDDIVDESEVPERQPGLYADAPVERTFPLFVRSQVTIVLPDGGAGYDVAGAPIDRTVAGWEFKRRFALRDGVLTLQVDQRTLAPEVPLAEVKAAKTELALLSRSQVFVTGPSAAPAGAAAVSGSPASDGDDSGMPSPPSPVVPPVTAGAADMDLKALAAFYSDGGRQE